MRNTDLTVMVVVVGIQYHPVVVWHLPCSWKGWVDGGPFTLWRLTLLSSVLYLFYTFDIRFSSIAPRFVGFDRFCKDSPL